MKRAYAFLAILLLAGCGTFSPAGEIPVSDTLSPEAKVVQTLINEGNAFLIAFNREVGEQKREGIITAQRRDYLIDLSDEYGKTLDEAQTFLRGGDILAARTKAELVKRLITALHREIARAARPQ